MYLLQANNLRVEYKKSGHTVAALDGVDFFLDPGVTTALAGESGCGKTTLARTLLKLVPLKQGSIFFDNRDITLRRNEKFLRKNVQIVFQSPSASLDPRYTIFQSMYEVLSVFNRVAVSTARKAIAMALVDVELEPDVMERYPHQLSGGQLQRVCIARSLLNKPRLVVLDEPTSSLDITTAGKIVELLARLQAARGIAFLFISHNLLLLGKTAEFVFVMYRGKVVEYGPRAGVYATPRHPYTRLLLEASRQQVKQALEEDLPAACPFYGRCDRHTETCLSHVAVHDLGERHKVFCNNFITY